jgi:putative transposase
VKQLNLELKNWGGKRRGAGRKPKHGKPGVSHRRREDINPHQAAHVTLKVMRKIWRLRSSRVFPVVRSAIVDGAQRDEGFRVTQFSIQDDHVHLIVEARDRRALSTGMLALTVRVAQRINVLMRRSGRVFKERYHSRVLRAPREARSALIYVLQNARKHLMQAGRRIAAGWMDPCSSAATFDGWASPIRVTQRCRSFRARRVGCSDWDGRAAG